MEEKKLLKSQERIDLSFTKKNELPIVRRIEVAELNSDTETELSNISIYQLQSSPFEHNHSRMIPFNARMSKKLLSVQVSSICLC